MSYTDIKKMENACFINLVVAITTCNIS